MVNHMIKTKQIAFFLQIVESVNKTRVAYAISQLPELVNGHKVETPKVGTPVPRFCLEH